MKKIYLSIICLSALLIFSCENEDLDPRPDLNDNVGAVTLVSVNPDKNFFNLLNNLATEEVEFTIDVDGFDLTTIESVEMSLAYTEKDGAIDPFLGIIDSVYNPVSLGTITSFPSTVAITAAQVATALGRDVADLEVGDSFVLTFPITTGDGRVLTVALSSDLCNQPAQPSAGGCSVQWAVSCPSDLAGDYTAAIIASAFGLGAHPATQAVTVTGSAGNYVLSDGTMDLFGPGFPIGMRFTEVCGGISVTPESIQFPTLVIYDDNGAVLDQGTGVITFDITYNSGSCCGIAGAQYIFSITPN